MADSLELNANFKPIQDSVNKLIESLNRLDKTLEENLKSASRFESLFTNTFDSLIKAIKELDTVSKRASSFEQLFGNSKNFEEFVTAVNRLGQVQAASFSTIARGLGSVAEAVAKLSNPISVSLFKEITTEIFELGYALSSQDIGITSEKVKQFSLISTVLKNISIAINSLRSLNSANLDNLVIPDNVLDSIRRLMLVIAEIDTGVSRSTEKNVNILQSIFRGITSTIFGQESVNSRGVVNISESLLSFSRALKNINKTINEVDVKKTLSVFAQLGGGLQLFSAILSRLPGQDTFADFSKVFQRLGIGISGLGRGVENLDIAGIKKLVLALTILSGSIKAITTIVRFNKNTEIFANVITAVTKALSTLAQIQTVNIKKQNIVSLDDIITAITKVVIAFSKLSGKKIPDLSQTITSLKDFINALSKDISNSALKNISKVVDQLVSALAKLNSVNVNTSRLKAVASQLEAISKLESLDRSVKSVEKAANIFTAGAVINGFLSFGRTIIDLISQIGTLEDRVAAAFVEIGRRFLDVGRNIQEVGEAILRNAGFQKLFELEASKVAIEFDAVSSSLKAFGKLTNDQLKTAQDFADQIGIKYPLSANEALKAILDLIKAGQNLQSVKFILPSAADLAALSDTGDLQNATRALIAAEGAFSEFAEDVPATFENIAVATNIIAAAADTSTASIEEINAGLADVGASAKTAGLNLQETSAALAILNDAQLRGAEGGRALRAALNAIFTRDQAAEEFKKLGIAIFDSSGNIRDFDSILKDLNRRFRGLTQQQIIESLGNISDVFGRTALSILIANDGISETIGQMNQVGTASERVAVILDNLKGDVDQLRGSFETLQKRALLPTAQRYLRPVVQLFRQLVDGILTLPDAVFGTISTFITLGASIATVIGSSTLLVGILTRLSGGFIVLIGSAARVIFNLQATVAVVGLLATSLTVVLPIIAALSGGLLLLSDRINTAFRLIQDNIAGAGNAFNNLKENVQELFSEIGKVFSNIIQVIRFTFDQIFNVADSTLAEQLVNLFSGIGQGIQSVIRFLKNIDTNSIIRFFIRLKFGIEDFLTSISNTITSVSRRVGDFFAPIIEKISILANEVKTTIGIIIGIFTGFGDEVKEFPLVDVLVGIVDFIRSSFINQIQEVINVLKVFNTLVLIPIRNNVPKIVEGIRLFVSTLVNIFKPLANFVLQQGEIIIDFFVKLPSALRDFTKLGSLVSEFAKNFINNLGSLPDALGQTITRIGVQLRSNFLVVLGRVFETGDVRPLINAIRRTFEKLITSIPRTLIRLGEETGNKYISGFGSALLSGRISQIIDSFVDLIRDIIGQAGIRLIKIFSNIFNNLFASVGNTVEQSFVQQLLNIPNTIINILAAPLQLAFQLLARGLDFASIGIELVAGLAKAIVESFFNLIPGIFATLAETTQNEALKVVLSTLADVGKRIADAISSFLTFPLQLVSSALQALSEFIDFLDRVGLLKQAAIFAAVAGIIAFKDAIIGLIATAKLTIIQPALIALNSLLFVIRNFAQQAIIQARVALLTFFTSLRSILSQAFLLSINAFNAGLATTGAQLVALGRASFAGIIAGIQGIGVAVKSVLATLAPIILLTAAIVALKAAFDGLSEGFRSGFFNGIIGFFESISVSVLNLLGLSDLVPQVQENFAMLRIIVQHWVSQIERAFQNVINRIIVAFSRIRADIEQFAGGGEFSKQFLGTTERLASIGQQSGLAFFQGLSATLQNPEDINSIRALLATSADKILEAFDDAFSSKNLEALRARPELAKTIFETLDLAGAVPDALSRLDIDEIFQFRQLLRKADSELAARAFGSFFEAAIRKGLSEETFVDEEVRRIFRNNIIESFEQGNITQEQAERFLEAIGFTSDAFAVAAGEIATRFDILGQSFEELFEKAQTSTLEDLRKQFEDGTISAEAYREAVFNLGDEISKTIEAIRNEKLQALTRQFDEGLISEEEYRQGLRNINVEAENLQETELLNAIEDIETAIKSGTISFEDGAKQIGELNKQLEELKNKPKDLTKELQKLNADFAVGAIDARRFAEEYERITKAIEDAKKASESGSVSTPEINIPTIDNTVDDLVEGQEDLNEALKEEERIRERIRDFRIDEARRLEDDLREEQKKRDEIEDIRKDAEEKERDSIEDFNQDRQRAEQDHQRRLLEIARSANKDFNDAIASRDASAAQAAKERLDQETRDEREQFRIGEERAREDFRVEQERARRERDQRIAEAQQSLQDLIDKNARERQRRLEDHALELSDLQAKIAAKQDVQAQADQQEQQAQRTQNTLLDNITRAGMGAIASTYQAGLNGLVSYTAQLLNQVVSNYQAAANAAYNTNIPRSSPVAPNRAHGGNVLRGLSYQVMDSPDAELLKIGGKTYLIPGKNGMIEAPKTLNRSGLVAGGAGSPVQVNINLGGFNINGAQGDPNALAEMIERRIVTNATKEIKTFIEQQRNR